MATKVASLYADVSANIGPFTSAMGAVKGTLTGAASSLAGFSSLALGAFSAAAIGAVAFQKALEFGDVGAQIGQTRDSFESLATTLGQGPELLNELQTATRGTVTELDLMRSTSTLLMGTSGALGQQLAENAPQLAAIAQAAHDLNPTMGTTAEMYDRLSRGIKKAEPELLDEVGILMNLTQVYKEYAASHGTTVTAMDKTMKTEAMLNAVLKQGNTLIEQAGNVNTSAATSIDRMQASLENMGNTAKERAAPAIADMANAVTSMLTPLEQVSATLGQTETTARASSQTYSEYASSVKDAANAAGYLVLENGNLVDAHMNLVQAGYMLTASEYAVNKSMSALYNSSNLLSGGLSTLDAKAAGFSNSVGVIDGGLSMLGETFPVVTEAVGMSGEALDVYSARLTGLAGYYAELEAAEQNRITTAGLMAGIQGQLGDATENYSQTLAQLTEQETQITDALVDAQERGYQPTSEKITELNQALTENQDAQQAALGGLQELTAEMIYQQAAAGLNAQSALDLARSMGVLSEQDYVVATSIQTLRESFTGFSDGILTAAEGANDFAAQTAAITKAAQNLQAKNLPVTFDNLTKELESLAQTDASTQMSDIAGAAADGAPALADVASAAGDAAGALDDSTGSAEDQADALADIQSAANKAVSGISSAGNAARTATTPLRTAANAADDLANSLAGIQGRTSISVSTSGFSDAISWVNQLTSALNGVPDHVTATISLSATTAGDSGGTGPPPPGPHNPTTIVNETYNVYDPLAATILTAIKATTTQERLEALING